MTECGLLLGLSFLVSFGLMAWLWWVHLKLFAVTASLCQWRGKAVTSEVLRSRDAYVKAEDTEALRPRDHSE
jgi:hypothetical protein